MSSKRVHRWVLDLITKLFPRLYSHRHDPIVRPPRKPVRLDFDLLDRRESPTNMSPVGPGAAWLAPFLSAAQPLPALVQASKSSEFNHLFAASDAGGQVGLARASRSAMPAEETSSLSPWGRIGPYGTAGDGATTGFSSMSGHLAGGAFAAKLDSAPSAESLIQDPFTLDAISQSKPPPRFLFPDAVRAGNISGQSEGGSAGGPSMPAASTQDSSASFRGVEDSAPATPALPLLPSVPNTPPSVAGAPNLPSPLVGEGAGGGSPVAPSSPDGRQGPHHKDPFWVLDANKAIVVTPGTTDNEFSNTAMDLRMQVSGTTVNSYSWDTSGAPDITGVSGASTYNLTFSWTSFTGAARSETIIAK